MSEQSPPSAPEEPQLPEWAVNLAWAQHHIRTNWEALVKPPVIMILLLTALIGYYVGSSGSREEIGVKNERISFCNEQVSAYRDRLQGATPDQAAKEIAGLRAKLQASDEKIQILMPDEPRHISEKQKGTLLSHKDELAKLKKPILVYAWYLGDSVQYALEFVTLLSSNNILALGPMTTVCEKEERGILVGLKDKENPSDDAKTFIGALKSSGFVVNSTKWNMQKDANLDFDLFICP
jgi:hypothetical protein